MKKTSKDRSSYIAKTAAAVVAMKREQRLPCPNGQRRPICFCNH